MTSNQRIATPDGLYTYADGSVFCGAIEAGGDQTARNPVLVVEVLSDSTRAYDEGEKLERYQTIPSLHTVLLVEPRERRITCWTRRPAGWTSEVAGADDAVRLAAWDLELKAADVYAGADVFPA